MPIRSHSPLRVYLLRSPVSFMFIKSSCSPSYVQEPNLSGQRCWSKGKYLTLILHELFVIDGMVQRTFPTSDTMAFVSGNICVAAFVSSTLTKQFSISVKHNLNTDSRLTDWNSHNRHNYLLLILHKGMSREYGNMILRELSRVRSSLVYCVLSYSQTLLASLCL